MHQYLRSVGFHSIQTKKQEKKLLAEVKDQFSIHEVVAFEEGLDFCEYRKAYSHSLGITVCGTLDEAEHFEREYYFPYLTGSSITSYADVLVERRMEEERFIGICEDVRVGVSLIFHLQNGLEYMRERELGNIPKKATSLTLSGLAGSGTVLFPIQKSEKQVQAGSEESRNRMMLLSAARNGDTDAIETLTMEDIETYTKVSRRLVKEDIFSIVDSYFMPYGVECDKYSVLGEIKEFRKEENSFTKEEVYIITLNVSELSYDICVPTNAVMGELAVGRRFKTTIWLQGYINF